MYTFWFSICFDLEVLNPSLVMSKVSVMWRDSNFSSLSHTSSNALTQASTTYDHANASLHFSHHISIILLNHWLRVLQFCFYNFEKGKHFYSLGNDACCFLFTHDRSCSVYLILKAVFSLLVMLKSLECHLRS
jgi:hypothetical protein